MSPYLSLSRKIPSSKTTPSIIKFIISQTKNPVRILESDKSKQKSIRAGSAPWYTISKQRGCTKVNEHLKNLYNWILQHPHVL